MSFPEQAPEPVLKPIPALNLPEEGNAIVAHIIQSIKNIKSLGRKQKTNTEVQLAKHAHQKSSEFTQKYIKQGDGAITFELHGVDPGEDFFTKIDRVFTQVDFTQLEGGNINIIPHHRNEISWGIDDKASLSIKGGNGDSPQHNVIKSDEALLAEITDNIPRLNINDKLVKKALKYSEELPSNVIYNLHHVIECKNIKELEASHKNVLKIVEGLKDFNMDDIEIFLYPEFSSSTQVPSISSKVGNIGRLQINLGENPDNDAIVSQIKHTIENYREPDFSSDNY